MPRTIEASFPVALPQVANGGSEFSKSYVIKLITPLIGGGVDVRVNDPVTLIRVPTIRGHLRFWWRATAGAQYETVAELRTAEAEIWGDTKNPSPIGMKVVVDGSGSSKPEKWAELVKVAKTNKQTGQTFSDWDPKVEGWGSEFPGYALFPFQRQKPNPSKNQELEQPPLIVRKVRFTLTVTCPNTAPDGNEDTNPYLKAVQTALWAWTNFGGLGSRTRRGCGALYCEKFAPKASDKETLERWIAEWRVKLGLPSPVAVRPWPTLLGFMAVKCLPQPQGPIQAWSQAIDTMREFRQGKGIGRNGPSNPGVPKKLGRSRWPEADSLRAISGFAQKPISGATLPRDHSTSITLPGTGLPGSPGFPRAAFGMPIVMLFMGPDKKELRAAGLDPTLAKSTDEPNDCEIYPDDPLITDPKKKPKRMASPIILRPLAFGDGSKAVPMVLRLHAPLPGNLRIESKTSKLAGKSFGATAVTNPTFSTYGKGISPMAGTSGSALEAFEVFVCSSFTKVTP